MQTMKNVFHPMGLAGFAGATEDKFNADLATGNFANYAFIDTQTSDFPSPAQLQAIRDTGNYSKLQLVSPDNNIVQVTVTQALFDAVTGGVYAPAMMGSMTADNKKWLWIGLAGVAAYWFFLRRR